ncbi:MAG: hypothetical protein LBV60_04005 [Streptomyces sp.]|nr:hypothetical protein [Streptomyces sp.]
MTLHAVAVYENGMVAKLLDLLCADHSTPDEIDRVNHLLDSSSPVAAGGTTLPTFLVDTSLAPHTVIPWDTPRWSPRSCDRRPPPPRHRRAR